MAHNACHLVCLRIEQVLGELGELVLGFLACDAHEGGARPDALARIGVEVGGTEGARRLLVRSTRQPATVSFLRGPRPSQLPLDPHRLRSLIK